MSQISSDPPIWPSQFIPGVGSVPGGPRVRTRITPGGDTEIQPSTGSAVVIPKSEEPVVHLNTLPTFEQIQEVLDNLPEDGEITSEEVNESFGEAAEGQPIKLEPDTESPTGLNEDYEDYENHFARLLAAHNAANRSHSGSSGRQESYNGPVRERTESRIATTSRERSRSPTRLRASTARRSERESPMFFPDKRECRDSGIGMSASPDPRRSHNDGSVSMSGTPSGEPPSAYQYDELVSRCQCPIGYTCPHRPADKLDCRPLVLEWKNWEDRQHQEAFDRHRMAAAHGDNRTTTENLVKIVGIINDFMQATTPARQENKVRRMRDWIMSMEDVTLEPGEQQEAATQQVLPALTQFLDPENARIRRAGRVPSFIEEELTTLKTKWGRGDFDGSIRRGLIEVQAHDGNGFRFRTRVQVDRNWPHFTSGLYFGAGNLVNGQLWMSRAELQRDGVHAPPIAGISGTANGGAYSIVLGAFNEKKNLGYADVDMGDIIDYMGTALPDQEGLGPTNEADAHMDHPDAWDLNGQKPTPATRAMMTSLRTGRPVRVVRSWKMCGIVKNKPRKGYRYDGLYKVVGMTALKEARQIWSFKLERLGNQGRLRGFARNEVQPDSSGRRKGHFYRERRRGT